MIYLDNSATTRVLPEVAEAVRCAMEEEFGNPSSPHGLGLRAERAVREAREVIARGLGVDAGEVVFTSGGTEANNLAVIGAARALRRRGDHVITTRVEHPSVLRACEVLAEEGFRVTRLGVDRQGRIDPAELAEALGAETVLVSVMHVNNEVGTIQPLEEVAEVLARRRRDGLPVWHVDAVQSFARLPLAPRRLGIDMVSLSAHKIHGPKGCGALYLRQGLLMKPLLVGGGQEGGRRSGTENVPGIVGFGVAARLLLAEGQEAARRMAGLRRRLLEGILAAVPWARVNGADAEADVAAGPGAGVAPHIASVSFPGLRGEVLVHALEERGVYASTGAACSARRAQPSHVLAAMGLAPEDIEGTIRFSLSPLTTAEEVEGAIAAVAEAAAELRAFARR